MPALVTVMSTRPEPEGLVAVMVVGELTTTLVAEVPPNLTVAPDANPVPVRVTDVPPFWVPLFGLIAVTDGAAAARVAAARSSRPAAVEAAVIRMSRTVAPFGRLLSDAIRLDRHQSRCQGGLRHSEKNVGSRTPSAPNPTCSRRRQLDREGSRARPVPDAHLAALAIEHGLTLCSTDGDFARFEGLRWEDPLRAG